MIGSKKIGFVGCGKLGRPTADLLSDLGYDIKKYDSSYDTGYTFEQAVDNRDLILIAVPTPHDSGYDGSSPISMMPPKDFDYSIVESVVKDACRLAPGTPIVIISTVLPGTMRKLFKHIDTNEIIYNPYLISMGAVREDLQNPDLVIVGNRDGVRTKAIDELFDLHAVMGDVGWISSKIHFGTWEEAESIKIFYNTFISTKIGLVNMIQDVAMKIGNMNVDVVTDALKQATMRITGPKYMTAGMGDGGGCHPRDNIALRWLAQDLDLGYDLFDSVMTAREIQAKNLARFLVDQAKRTGLEIAIHGKAFKPGVPNCDGSYSLLIGHYIHELTGRHPIYIDPLTGNNCEAVRAVILLAHSNSVTYNYLQRDETEQYYCEFLSGSVIVDPWRKYRSTNETIEVIHYGNTRRSSS